MTREGLDAMSSVPAPTSKQRAEPLAMALGRFGSGLEPGALGAREIETLTFAVMDCLACALAGAGEPVTLCALKLVVSQCGSAGPVAILGHSARGSPTAAALVNGSMAHASDFDDLSEPMCGHPTAPALPAILALAERERRSGLDVLVALAAANEIMSKLGRIAGHELFRAGLHPTATLGVLGAAAGAARILGLDPERTAIAIAIAASRAAGLRANIGSMVKPLHCGFAARDGVEAALLAQSGASANLDALDGVNGFLAAFARGYESTDAIAGSLGAPFDLVEPGLVFKKYPSCWDTHSAVEAALALRETHRLQAGDVKSIRVALAPGMGGDLTYHDPRTPLEGKFSIEFCVAAALAKGCLTLAEFDQQSVADPLLRRLIAATELVFDPSLSDRNPRSFCAAARVDLVLQGEQNLSRTVQFMRGHPENPMTRREFEEKFAMCASSSLDPARMRACLAMINGLPTLPEVGPLLALLTVPARG
jgi:2-methylcitrate dehydratase PrpD